MIFFCIRNTFSHSKGLREPYLPMHDTHTCPPGHTCLPRMPVPWTKVCHLPHTVHIAPYVFIFAQCTSFVNHYFDKFFTKKCQISDKSDIFHPYSSVSNAFFQHLKCAFQLYAARLFHPVSRETGILSLLVSPVQITADIHQSHRLVRCSATRTGNSRSRSEPLLHLAALAAPSAISRRRLFTDCPITAPASHERPSRRRSFASLE